MNARLRTTCLSAVTALLATLSLGVLPASSSPTSAVTQNAVQADVTAGLVGHDGIVSSVPADWTPQILDGKVLGIAEAGPAVVVGGSFTQTSQTWGGAVQGRSRLLALDADDGRLNSGFDPTISGGQVNAVIPGPTPGTVYVGGTFPGINGQSGRVFLLDASTGALVNSFTPPSMNGQVRDLVLSGGRLYVAGLFSSVGGSEHRGLVALDASSGATLDFLQVQLTENHNWTEGSTGARAGVGASKIAIDPAGTTLAVIGNFRKADGLERRQMAMIDLTGSTGQVRPDWRTRRYEPACYSWAFDTYVRDLAASPDGDHFVVSTTGGGNPGTLCDTVARWDIGASGDDVQPAWVDESGGDSLLGVTTSGTAVYAGGHQRWGNNHDGRDFANPGSVPRPGLTGYDATSGIPLAWNPGRHPRGVGAEEFTVTEDGLWMGSDGEWVGRFDYRRARLAFFPREGGYELGSGETGGLPSNAYFANSTQSGGEDVLFRVNAGGPQLAALDNGPAWQADQDSSSSWRNSGSNAAGWDAASSMTAGVPASTPLEVFSSERWDPADGEEMSWAIPVPQGTDITVRLYLGNRCDCTAQSGQRVFDVALDGDTVLDDLDLVERYGHDVGGVQEFDITSDGTVDIDFLHEIENTLVNGIEIVERGAGTDPAPAPTALQRVWFTGGEVQAEADAAPDSDIDWSSVRGAEMIDGELFYTTSDRAFHRRGFDGQEFGPASTIDPYRDPYWMDYPTGSGSSTYGGVQPSFYGQIPSIRGLAYLDHEMYYTRAGSSSLFARGFLPDSGILRETTRTVPGFSESNVGELFFDAAGQHLYFTNTSTGELSRIGWNVDGPEGTAEVVSGPGVDDMDWRSTALFLADGPPPADANEPPVAVVNSACDGLGCAFDGIGSQDPDGTIESYAWDLGDGSTATGAQVEHAYGAAGDYTVTLTVTDDDGATNTTTREVSVVTGNEPPEAAVDFSCAQLDCSFAGAGSSDPDGTVESYAWDLGDGSTATGAQVEHAYGAAGDYTVTLTVTDDDGATDTVSQVVTVTAGNQAPQAALDISCTLLECVLDGTGSQDPDGTIESYAWDLGDGSTATGAQVEHAYGAAGDYTVTLTVTDDDGAEAQAVSQLQVQQDTAPGQPELVGVSAGQDHSTSVSVPVPDGVQEGDTLLAFLTAGDEGTVSGPTGVGEWNLENETLLSPMAVRLYSRVADGTEADQTITVSTADLVKWDLTVVAYRGTGNQPVEVLAAEAVRNTATHTSPEVQVSGANRMGLTYWSDRGGSTTEWTPPPGPTLLSTQVGSGGGRVSSLLVAEPAPAGTYGGLTARTNVPTSRAVSMTVVVTP